MGIKERRERSRLETRQLILDAARELFIEFGYEGVSMRKVAAKIEYSPTAIYVHFRDKAELFTELCREDFDRLAEISQEAGTAQDPIERLRRNGEKYIEFALQHPSHYRFMFMTPHPEERHGEPEPGRRGNPEKDAYAFLKQGVERAIAAGAFRPELQDAELVAQTLWAAVHGVISLEIAKCRSQENSWVDWRPVAERAHLMMEALFKGLLTPKPAAAKSSRASSEKEKEKEKAQSSQSRWLPWVSRKER